MEFRTNARVHLDLPVMQQGLCQHRRRQKSDGTAGARCPAQLDEQGQHAQKWLIGGDRAKLHDVWLPHHTQRLLRSGAQIAEREVVVSALVTERLTEPRVDVDAWGHLGLPHMRLHFTVVDAEALASCPLAHEKSAGCGAGCSTSRENEGEQIRKSDTRSWSHRHSHAAQRAVRPGTGRTSPEDCGVKESDHQGSREGRWTVTAGVAKAPKRCAGQMHRCDNPLGHRAQSLQRSVELVAL